MKVKVLHLIGSFNQGGSELQALQLVRLLEQSERYFVHLACLDSRGVMRSELDSFYHREIPEYRLNSFYDLNAIKQLRRFVDYLRRNQIAIVQTHDFYTNVFGMIGAALAGIPVRIAARREIGGVRTSKQLLIERFVYRLADAVVANSQAVRRQLVIEGVKPEKVFVVYNGLDEHRLALAEPQRRSDIIAQLHLPDASDFQFVTIVANMHYPVKDHETFLRSARLVCDEIPHTGFLIAGEGALTQQVKELSEALGLEANVFFVGQCKSVGELLSMSDVCVLSSKAEGFPNVVLEYMAAARPVVATDVGGVQEAVRNGESGYLVRPKDHKAMAERIVCLLRNPDVGRTMGERGRTIVRESFSTMAQLTRTETLYETLLHTDGVLQETQLQVEDRREDKLEHRGRSA